MHAMWKPQKFKLIYLIATLYVLTLTLPSASAVYWAFGDNLLNRSNALSLLPRTGFRDTAIVLMLIHQVHFFLIIFVFKINHDLILLIIFMSSMKKKKSKTVHNVWIRLHSSLLRVGEIRRDTRDKKLVQTRLDQIARGRPDMVPSYNIPIFRTDKLHSWITSC